jgi:hypothetical protein
VLKYDEALSHSIYAASDIFVIPSIFEPCGLTQVCHSSAQISFYIFFGAMSLTFEDRFDSISTHTRHIKVDGNTFRGRINHKLQSRILKVCDDFSKSCFVDVSDNRPVIYR